MRRRQRGRIIKSTRQIEKERKTDRQSETESERETDRVRQSQRGRQLMSDRLIGIVRQRDRVIRRRRKSDRLTGKER